MTALLLVLVLSAVEALPVRAAETSAVDRGRAAAKQGDWEAASDHFADALFADPKSPEARDLLRTAAEHAMEQRTAWIQRERARVLFELGLGPMPEEELPPPPALDQPQARKIGPPTLKPARHIARKPRRTAALETAEVVAPPEHIPTPADREMAKFFYFQGLKAYAESELEEAKQAWRRALELDPKMERAQNALDRIEHAGRK
jgi:tetratricopeptide (TPR) repeat protein